MATPSRHLPANPSPEHLRKQAKRLAAAEGLQLAVAQRRLAAEYGQRSWAALMRAAAPRALAPLIAAAARADAAMVRALLAQGAPADGPALREACAGDGPAAARLAVATLLLDAGASPRQAGADGATALHAAARRGPLALVELLIRRGALSWQRDGQGREALDHARAGAAPDRDEIVALLDRPVIRDPRFRAAVQAIHAGDVAALGRLLDAHPGLLREHAIEPDCYPRDYFRDPKLFWFIANNPTLTPKSPPNIVELGRLMIERGVAPADLDYTLELVMTNAGAPEQAALVALLLGAGATATPQAILMTLGHGALAPVETLLDRGLAMTAPIAAALGRDAALPALLAGASPAERQEALGLAVINRRVEAARLALAAGADPNGLLAVHRHSTPLHQAAVNDDLPMLQLLVAHGARLDARDTLWNGTPLGWAVHAGKPTAEAYLRSLDAAGTTS